MLEDSRGYLWFGTYEGISIYNGYELVIYINRVGETPLVSNRARTLFEDINGKIWIGTDEDNYLFTSSHGLFNSIY